MTWTSISSRSQYLVAIQQPGFVSGGPGIFQGDTFQSAPIASGMPFAFQIWDATGCDTLQVTGVENCDCLTDAGNFIETMVDVCWTDTLFLTFSGNGFLEGDDIRQYVLHQGTSIQLQSIKAWNDQPVFVFDPTTMMTGVTYYVSPVAGNNLSGTVDTTDLCLSVTPGIPVIFHGSPGLITPVGDTICASMIYDLPVLFNGTAPYILSYQMNGGAIQQQGFVSGTGSLSITGMTSGMVQFLTLSDGYCTTGLTDSFQLVVHSSPSVINIDVDCDGSNASYVVTFQITGGDSTTYTVSGPGVLTGTVFQSDPLSAGSTYSFLVTDQHDCSPVLVSGNHDCLCQTDAGDLLGGPVFICAGDSLWVQGSGTFLDADDTLVYWLVSDFMDPVKTMLWQFDQSHLFYPGLPVMTGQVYYVVAVAGNSGNTGAIDTTDVCLDYSNSIPVTFVQPPVVHAILPSPSNQFTCQDTIITLAAITAPVSGLNYSWTTFGGTLLPPANLSSVKTTSPGWYTILLTEQTAGCQDSAGIWLGASLGLPQVAILPPALLNCMQLSVTLDASGSVTGPNSVFSWSTFDGQIISGSSTSVAQVDQTGTYQLSITDLSNNCSSTGSILVYQDTIPPVADAGPDLVIPCGQSAGVLSGINSSGQSALSFAWSTQGGALSGPTNQMTAHAAQSGKYLLTVTDNQNGCMDADEVNVTQAGGLIVSGILVDPPLCFGEASGQITLESITGGQGPYQAMLGSISMPAPGSFSGITGGTYLLRVNDALGCTWDSTVVVEVPPAVLIDLGLDLTVDFGTTVVLTPNVLSPGSGIGSFVWSDPDSILCLGCPQLTVLPTTDMFISLEVEDQMGCTAEEDILIRVILRRRVFIPNSFSPNFDGINDVFALSGGETVDRVKSMAVYDRWGNSLFLRKDFPADGISGWNGQYRGQQMDPGVYVYVVEVVFIDGSERLYKGDLQIMR
ncbi:MAG: gliding motility-associated C-terminal domain-containing protein [Saprospiraceae bacterium]|nr:gliding motility-associated C-terminal domain-containing protein [Saprospiraceae bacterium]